MATVNWDRCGVPGLVENILRYRFISLLYSSSLVQGYCPDVAMSDSEDDFMSDKFLVEALKPRSESEESYTARPSAQQLRSLRAGQAKQLPSLKQKEEEQRRAGLATSLFDSRTSDPGGSYGAGGGGGGGGGVGGGAGKVKAMEMMMKMGWKVGEGLGRKRSPTPEVSTKRVKSRSEVENGDEDEAPRGGIGSSSRPTRPTPRTEPIRISMWAGRKGLSARSPSPPPLINFAGRNPDALDPRKMARLEGEAESFRERQRREFGEREVERKEGRAREMLVSFDRDKGVKVGFLLSSLELS